MSERITSLRTLAGHRRQPPIKNTTLVITPTGQPRSHPPGSAAPDHIWVYVTDVDPTDRLQEAVRTWADRSLALTVVSFDGGLIRSGVIEAVATTHWSVTLITDGADLTGTANIDAVLRAGIDEVHVYPAGLGERAVNRRVLDAVRELVDLRQARGQNRPCIICRVCADTPAAAELRIWSRQVPIDEWVVAERRSEKQHVWGLWSKSSVEPA